MSTLTRRFDEAFGFAHELHAGQKRKGTAVPYLGHLMGVASIVLDDGGSEDEAIAALLHDAVEDGGGRPVLEEIRRRFGDRVAEIVWACSDTDETPKPPWKERKTRYIAHVRQAGRDARRVSCADKLHNARSILRDYRALGEKLWDRFTATGDQTLWYYKELVAAFQQPDRSALVAELERVVSELEAERKRVLGHGPGAGV